MIKVKILLAGLILVCSTFTFAQKSNDPEESIDKYLKYFSDENPGAVVAVYKKGEILFNKAYGLANVEQKQKMQANQLFNLQELSKAFTSLAIMKLVEKNKLELEDDLVDIFNGFPDYGRKVQVKYLLNHTSGLNPFNEQDVQTGDQLINYLSKQDSVLFKPGSKSNYSNSDYALLAKIIEVKSGMTYPEFIRKNILRKLKMNNTYFAHELDKSYHVAAGHFKNEEKEYYPDIVLSGFYGEQGIYTTSQDFAKWDYALYTNKLLKCENLQKIFTVVPLPEEKRKHYYGGGWALMKRNETRYYWQGGMGGGYTNLILHLPDTQTTVLILTNRNDGYDFLKMAIYIAKQFDKSLKL
ncbi:MAG: beta-lactamase family protein [Bacteroidetes bacterium]|nr:beta-lactamase family protein [Bacteroidota bacterium]